MGDERTHRSMRPPANQPPVWIHTRQRRSKSWHTAPSIYGGLSVCSSRLDAQGVLVLGKTAGFCVHDTSVHGAAAAAPAVRCYTARPYSTPSVQPEFTSSQFHAPFMDLSSRSIHIQSLIIWSSRTNHQTSIHKNPAPPRTPPRTKTTPSAQTGEQWSRVILFLRPPEAHQSPVTRIMISCSPCTSRGVNSASLPRVSWCECADTMYIITLAWVGDAVPAVVVPDRTQQARRPAAVRTCQPRS